MKIVAVPQLTDNYAYLVCAADGQCAVVDPADDASIEARCAELGVTLTQIWATHHHADHTAGIAKLLAHAPEAMLYVHPVDWQALARRDSNVATVAAQRVVLVDDGDQISLAELRADIIFNPGHTMGAISYYLPGQGGEPGAVFTGDTLFGAGCGRRFEGSADVFFASLMRLASLPGETAVYFGHEYTASNLRFAAAVEPANAAVAARTANVAATRARGAYTTPSSMAAERATNPFLRCDEPAVIASVQAQRQPASSEPAHVFAALRAWKDGF